jgi:hypothetical protein
MITMTGGRDCGMDNGIVARRHHPQRAKGRRTVGAKEWSRSCEAEAEALRAWNIMMLLWGGFDDGHY